MVRLSGVRIARHHAACRTVDTKPRRGILADDPVSDRFGRRRCLRPLRGCGKGGAVEFLGEVPFVRTERWGIGGFRYHWLCSLFRTLSQPLPVPENGTISLSRAQSSLLELSRREMEHENEGIIEAFRGGGPPPTTVCRSRTVHLSGMPAGSGQRLRKRWIVLSERTIFF